LKSPNSHISDFHHKFHNLLQAKTQSQFMYQCCASTYVYEMASTVKIVVVYQPSKPESTNICNHHTS